MLNTVAVLPGMSSRTTVLKSAMIGNRVLVISLSDRPFTQISGRKKLLLYLGDHFLVRWTGMSFFKTLALCPTFSGECDREQSVVHHLLGRTLVTHKPAREELWVLKISPNIVRPNLNILKRI